MTYIVYRNWKLFADYNVGFQVVCHVNKEESVRCLETRFGSLPKLGGLVKELTLNT